MSDPSERLSERRVKESSLALALGGHWPTVLGVHWDKRLFVRDSAEQRKSHGDGVQTTLSRSLTEEGNRELESSWSGV